jgi:hypothetical protein
MRWFWLVIIGVVAVNALVVVLIGLALLAGKWRGRKASRRDAPEPARKKTVEEEQPEEERAPGE